MSQVSNIEKNEDETQGIRLPIDGLFEFIADRIGGSKSKEVLRFLKFGTVGTLGAIIDLGISNILMATILVPIGDMQLVNTNIAQTISFIAAVISNFIWNRYWTYPDSRSRPLGEQLTLFAFISTVGWIARFIWISFAAVPFGNFVADIGTFPERVSNQLGATIAIFFGIFVVMIWNFIVNRLWTYNDVD